MRLRKPVMGITLAALFWALPVAYGQDLAAFARFLAQRGIPIEGKEGLRQAVREYFSDYDHAIFSPIAPDYRIIGPVGVAWGNFRLAAKQKNGPLEHSDGRYMFTYTLADGKWVLISMHYSLLRPLMR